MKLSFPLLTFKYCSCIQTFYVVNIPDNVRDPKDTILFQFNTQILDNTTSVNLATPTPEVRANFGAQITSQRVPLKINEPNLQISIAMNVTYVDALDRVTATATFSHIAASGSTGSTSAAHDLVVVTQLPVIPSLTLVIFSLCCLIE